VRWMGLALVLLLTVPVAAGEDEAPTRVGPFLGIEGLDLTEPAHRDPERLALLQGAAPLLGRTRPLAWGVLEPHPPVMGGRHLRDWEALDPSLAAWTEAGLDVVLVLDPRSTWASEPVGNSAWRTAVRAALPEADAEALVALGRGAMPPLEERWADWELLIRDLVERYDGDETADAPGARLRWIQVVERPASSRDWIGSASEYGRLLNAASQGAQRASYGVRIVHGLVDFATLGYPPGRSDAELMEKLLRTSRKWPEALLFEVRRELELASLTLSLGGIFSAVPHAASEHLADERADLISVRHVLDHGGNQEAEVWLAATPAERHGSPELEGAHGPDAEEQRIRSRWVGTARRRSDAQYGLALHWLERGRACDVVRSLAAGRAAGATRVFVGGSKPGEGLDVFVAPRTQGGWRRTPAWYALRQAHRLLAPHTSAHETRIGRACSACRFEMRKDATLPWVLLVARDADVSWSGHPRLGPVVRDVAVPLPDGRYIVEQISLGDGEPKRRDVQVRGGGLQLPLTSAPVWIYPDV